MKSSEKRTNSALSVWQFILLITVVYILGLFISHHTTVFEKIHWSGYKLQMLNENDRWTDSNRFNIGSNSKIQTVRFTVEIDNDEKWQRPIGLMIGGPFSADIYWDNEQIGNKGVAGDTPENEVAGTIDSITFIPAELLTPGLHQIQLRISTQHLLLHDDSVFHYISLAPYRENGRRDLRYYAVPLTILSALVVLSFQSLRIGHNAGNSMHTGLGLFGFSIIVLLLSEVSRAVINYEYPYHELRGIIGWISNVSAGLILMLTCNKVTGSRLSNPMQYLAISVLIASYFFTIKSGDMRLAFEFLILVFAPSVIFLTLLVKGKISYLSTLPLFWLMCVVSNTLSVGLFLDSYQFISSLILIGGAWLWVYVDIGTEIKKDPKQNAVDVFKLRVAGEDKYIPTTDCIALKGEGNYTTLILIDGNTHLHQDGIGAVMDTNPQGFVRVHKSYAVNLNSVSQLRSATGSKYWLELSNHQTIPVSRYRVAELRSLLELQTEFSQI